MRPSSILSAFKKKKKIFNNLGHTCTSVGVLFSFDGSGFEVGICACYASVLPLVP
jgi:hypothetical protein